MKRVLNTLIFGLISLFVVPSGVHAVAHLHFSSPPATVCQGDTFTLQLLLDANEAINAGQIDLSYNSSLAQIDSMNWQSSIFRFFAEGPQWDNGAGTIHMIGGLPTPGFQGTNGLIAELTMTTNGLGNPGLSYNSGTTDILRDDGFGTSTTVTYNNVSFTVLPSTHPSCTGPVNISGNLSILIGGTTSLTATGGDGVYSWSAPSGTPSAGSGASFVVSYAAAGTYVVTVTDGAGKTAQVTMSVSVPAPPPPPAFGCSPNSRSINPGGTAAFSAVGGTGPYGWTTTGGTPAAATGNSFSASYSNLGSFVVTMTDALGSSDTCTVNVVPPTTPPPTPTPCPTCQLFSDDGEPLDLRLCEVQVECTNAESREFDVFLGADDPTQCPIVTRCQEDAKLTENIVKNILIKPFNTFIASSQGVHAGPFILGIGLGLLLALAAYAFYRTLRHWYLRVFRRTEHPPRYPDIPHNQ